MPVRREGRWLRILGAYVLFAALLWLALTPLYFYAGPFDRPLVVRLGVGAVLGVALIHLVRIARARLAEAPPSAFDRALGRPPVEPRFAALFLKVRDEVRFGTASQAYFENVLEPRLQRLRARRTPSGRDLPLLGPRGRRWFRRGPSLAALRAMIADIEEHP